MGKTRFGEKLQQLRNSKGWSQGDVADKLGVATSTISMYERSQREPNFETMNQIASLFGVTVDELVGKETPRNDMGISSALNNGEMEFGFSISRSSRLPNGGHVSLMFEGKKPILKVNGDSSDFTKLYAKLCPEDKISVCKEMLRRATDELVRG